MRRKKNSSNATVEFTSGQDIQELVKALEKRHPEASWGKAYQDELRRLMSIWYRSGQSVRRVFLYEPTLNQRDLKMQALFVPVTGRTGRILLGYLPGSDSDPELTALSIFLHFLANPENIRLGGPCPCCKKHFYKKVLRGNHRYCSSVCSRRDTSAICHRNERNDARREKIERAERFIRQLPKREIQNGRWKQAVHRLCPEISVNWLTRAKELEEIFKSIGERG